MADSSSSGGWMWLEDGAQKGPVSTNSLSKHLQRRDHLPNFLLGLTLWQPGMAEWARGLDTPPFRDHILALTSSWFCADPAQPGGLVGPFTARDIAKKFDDGALDGLSLLFQQTEHAPSSSWVALGELHALRSAIAAYSVNQASDEGEDEEEEDGAELQGAVNGGTANTGSAPEGVQGGGNTFAAPMTMNPADMVFQGNNEEMPPLPDSFRKQSNADGDEDGDDEEGDEEDISEVVGNVGESGGGGSASVGNSEATESGGDGSNGKEKRKRTKKKKGAKWSEKAASAHSWVYVENLPPDANENELAAHFSKCGVIAIDPSTQQRRIKLYKDASGFAKGDASVCYAKVESVPLALQVLDGSCLRATASSSDKPLKVTKAEFTVKGSAYDPAKRTKVNVQQRKVAKAAAAQALMWNEDDDSGMQGNKAAVGLKIVVLKHMFDPADFERDPNFEHELKSELVTELEEKVGEPEKITLFAKNPQGVIVVKFKTAFASAECVKLMHQRYFGGKQLECIYWDGVTDYTVAATAVDEAVDEKRVDQFGDWIDEQDLPDDLQLKVE